MPSVSDHPSAGAALRLGDRLRQERMAQKRTLRNAAARSGTSIALLSAYEHGTRGKRPRYETLEKLARGYGIPVDELLRLAGVQPPPRPVADEGVILTLVRQLHPADRSAVLELLRALARRAKA